METKCDKCGEFLAMFYGSDGNLCLKCHHAEEVCWLESKIKLLEQALQTSDFASNLGRKYCPGCEKKLRPFTAKEKQTWRKTLEEVDPELKSYFEKLMQDFENEPCIYEKK